MIITHNESINLPHCLRSLKGWTNKIFVVDSGSTDDTPQIAQALGADVVHHDWEGYAAQKNWGLDNLPFESPWILILDADEVITDRLRKRLSFIASAPVDDVTENGFFINRLTYFLGKPIRHCGFFPSWNLRFFKRGIGRYEDRQVHEHVIIDDPVGYVREPMLHDDRRGLEHYFAKHNRYSTLEAREIFNEITGRIGDRLSANVAGASRRNRWLKRYIAPRMPFPGLIRFLYMYILRLGILDGRVGLDFCQFIGAYEHLVAMKLRELKRLAKNKKQIPISQVQSGLAVTEGNYPTIKPQSLSDKESISQQSTAAPMQMHPEASPWTFKEKLGRAIWMLIGRPIFRLSFHNWHRLRVSILRIFGATVGKDVAIRPTVNIEVPWMVEIEDGATIGDYAILYSLGKIHIGKRSIISQYAHLCAGTHDYTDHSFRLIRSPITIGDDVWIGADAFVGPGVSVGSLSVIGARSSTYKDVSAQQVYVGNPAKPIKERVLK
ncbi:MAG: colanic acid biosynthesis acetyltransferase WcaF [Planctomycetes bacterium]|nr:colanic acid biosynthesis acetyltransferase WcaF [Planctomycetota bacterium]